MKFCLYTTYKGKRRDPHIVVEKKKGEKQDKRGRLICSGAMGRGPEGRKATPIVRVPSAQFSRESEGLHLA